MTREEAIAVFKGFKFLPREMKAVDMAIKALEQEPCTDAISRQAVLDAFWKLNVELRPDAIDAILNMVNGIPPVTAEKVGHWEWVQYDSNPNIGHWHCSECRIIIPHMPENTDNTPIYKWCPMCGVKMGGEQDEADN